MNKTARRFFRIVFFLVILGLILAFVSTLIFQRQIGNRVLTKLNEQIHSELSAEDISMSIWPKFPRTSAKLSGVYLNDLNGDILMKAEEVNLDLKLTSLFSSNYLIYGLKIEDGDIYLKIDPAGKSNYTILKNAVDSTGSQTPSSGTTVSIDKAILSNLKLHYDNQQHQHKGLFSINNMEIEGEFSSQRFEMKNTAALNAAFYDTDQLRFLEEKEIEFSSAINVDLNAKSYELDRALLVIDNNPFRLEGDIEKWEIGYYLDLFISSENGSLEAPIQLLPSSYEKLLSRFKSQGNANFSAIVKGLWGENQNPEIKAQVQLQEGSIEIPTLNQAIENAHFALLFNNGDLKSFQTSFVELRDFQGQLNNEGIDIALMVTNFENPNIEAQFDGKIPLAVFQPVLQDSTLKDLGGTLDVRQFSIKGRYENMISPGYIGLVQTEGQLELQNTQFTVNTDTAQILSGLVDLSNNKARFQQLKFQGFDSDLNIEGTAFNVIPFILADSINSEDVELEFNATIQSQNLDLDKMLTATGLLQDSTSKGLSPSEIIQKRERISQFLKGSLQAQVDQLSFQNLKGQNFAGTLNFANNEVQINGTTESMEGQVELDAQLLLEYRPQLEAQLSLSQINAQTFLQQNNNLGQEFITTENLKGKLDGHFLINAYWDQNGQFLKEKLKTTGQFTLQNGTFQNITPIQSWAKFIKAPSLDSIPFSQAQAYLEIRRQKVYVPSALITSDSFNLAFSGEHRRNNNFRYHLKLNANTSLAKRIDTDNKNADPTTATQSGYYNFYHSIYGHPDNFDIRQAKNQVQAEFERNQIRKGEIHKTLLQVFGGLKLFEEPEGWKEERVIK